MTDAIDPSAEATALARFSLPANSAAPRAARRRIEALDGLAAPLVGDARLVLSELVSNAVRHAAPPDGAAIDVVLRREQDALVIEVDDHGAFSCSAAHAPRASRAGGFGLRIVERLCERWHADTGRVVARIALPG